MSKLIKRTSILVFSIFFVWFILFLFPLRSAQKHAFFKGDKGILVIAHRGGKHLAPENTLAAFRKAQELNVDILEYDVHLTSDKELVVIHDASVDRTTNGTGKVNEMTLEEVQQLDAGYHFEDEAGNSPFRDKGVQIPLVSEVFEEFHDSRHLIELKASNDSDLYEDLIMEMWKLIEQYNMHENVLVASFDHSINLRFNEVADGKVAIGAGEEETRTFVTYHKAFLNALYRPTADAFQLPVEQEGHDLTDWKLIRGANNRGMALYYWTINDKETMRELIDKGVDGIMTDNPELLNEVLAEYKVINND